MLHDIATHVNAEAWALGSTFFFIGVFVIVVARLMTRRADTYRHHAGLPLEDAPAAAPAKNGEEV